MKKVISLILVLIVIFFLVSCARDEKNRGEISDKAGDMDDYGGEPVSAFSGIIIEIGDNWILVEPDAESNEAKSADRISVSLNDIAIDAKIGDRVAILYEGGIAESYPAQIHGTVAVDVIYNWGIVLSVENISPTGVTVVCTQLDGEITGEINTGEDYALEVKLNGKWEDVPTVIEDYGWNSIAYIVTMNGESSWDINWEWLYGELDTGEYRISKSFMDFRGPGDYDTAMLYAEFTIK